MPSLANNSTSYLTLEDEQQKILVEMKYGLMIESGHLNHYQTMPQPHMVKLNLEEGFGLSSLVEPQILCNQIQIEIQNLNLLLSL